MTTSGGGWLRGGVDEYRNRTLRLDDINIGDPMDFLESAFVAVGRPRGLQPGK